MAYKEGTYYAKNREKLLAQANRRSASIRGALAAHPKPAGCELCSRVVRLVWDHDHTTGKFRGWICYSCNIALGQAFDKPALLRKMADYVEASRE